MRILFIERWVENPRGGVKSIQTLFEETSKEHKTKFLWRGDRETSINEDSVNLVSNSISPYVPLELEKLSLFMEPHLKELYSRIDDFDPDLIVTQSESSYIAVKYAEENDCRSCIFLRAWELLYSRQRTHLGNRRVSKMANSLVRPLNKKIADYCLENADLLIANSEFTAGEYERYSGRRPDVVYPFVDIEQYKTSGDGDKILHVGGTQDKGIEITLQVAERMPEEEFIVAGEPRTKEIEDSIENLDNLECLGYVDDMRKAYSQARIVMVPSQWDEPFGRIPLEAGASGIPAVVSDRGGLLESSGVEDLVVSNQEPENYIEKIEMLDRNYEEFSKLASKNANEKSMKRQVERFLDLI